MTKKIAYLSNQDWRRQFALATDAVNGTSFTRYIDDAVKQDFRRKKRKKRR